MQTGHRLLGDLPCLAKHLWTGHKGTSQKDSVMDKVQEKEVTLSMNRLIIQPLWLRSSSRQTGIDFETLKGGAFYISSNEMHYKKVSKDILGKQIALSFYANRDMLFNMNAPLLDIGDSSYSYYIDPLFIHGDFFGKGHCELLHRSINVKSCPSQLFLFIFKCKKYNSG